MSKEFRIKNVYIGPFCQWLHELYLEPKQSRIRTKFIDILIRYFNDNVQAERTGIIQKYSNKDAEGNPSMILDSSGRTLYDIPQEKTQEMNEEYNKLLHGEYVVKINEDNVEMLKIMKEIVLEPEYRFGPRETDSNDVKQMKMNLAAQYNEWAKSFDCLEFE